MIKSVLSIYGSDRRNFRNAYHGYDLLFWCKRSRKENILCSQYRKIYLFFVTKNIKVKYLIILKISKYFVRDKNTAEFVHKLINKEPQIVLDPTLIYTPKILEDQKFISRYVENDYAIIYGTVFSQQQQPLSKIIAIKKIKDDICWL